MCMRCVLAAVLTLTAEPPSPPQPEQQAKKDPGIPSPVAGYKMQADSQVRRAEKVNTAAMDATAQQEPDRPVLIGIDYAQGTPEAQVIRLQQENRNLCAELARVTNLAMKFQEEADITRKFAVMLSAKL